MPKQLFEKGKPKHPDSGRKKGQQNKSTLIMKSVRDTVLDAFNVLQKDAKANIVEWGRKHPKDFYQIAAKLIPTEISNKVVLIGKDLEDEQYIDDDDPQPIQADDSNTIDVDIIEEQTVTQSNEAKENNPDNKEGG